jgi:cyanophycinase
MGRAYSARRVRWRAVSKLGLLLALALTASACAPAAPPRPAPDAATAGGHLFIVGGGARPPELMQRFVELAGGAGRARIAVLPMASGIPHEVGPEQAAELRALGAEAFVLDLTREQAHADSVLRLIDGLTGVWFSGGDQSRLTAALGGTPTLRAIHARFRAGAVVGGTSAGAAVMSDSMITGEQFLPGQDTAGFHDDAGYRRIARRWIHIVPGFGFLPGAVVDQHFVERERHNRLLSAVLERPSLLGAGIAESTALVVRPDGRWEVAGSGLVVVYDARRARITPDAAAQPGAADLRLHLLPAGSSFDPATGRATVPPR